MPKSTQYIEVYGARAHNLKNIDIRLPRHALTVITGLSGSGKSSLAFDTIFAEGQRRYIETFSAYARGFLGGAERPDVDKITGLSPVISIEQKTVNKNPRSTVGTITEIYDYLRLLYARAGTAYSWATGERMVKYTEEQVLQKIRDDYQGRRIYILAPLVRQRKGHYRELFDAQRRKGFLQVRVDGELTELVQGMKTDRYRQHNIELVIDKMPVGAATDDDRLLRSLQLAMRVGEGTVMILDHATGEAKSYSRHLVCPTTGMSYAEPAPNNFSFNSPEGMCPRCKGLGEIDVVDAGKLIPDPTKSIAAGAIEPLGKARRLLIFAQIEAVLARHGATLKTPIDKLPAEALDEVLYGSIDPIEPDTDTVSPDGWNPTYDGVLKYLADSQPDDDAEPWTDRYLTRQPCPECHGARLRKEALAFRIGDKNIAEAANLDIADFHRWIADVQAQLEPQQRRIAEQIVKEIRTRAGFLLDVGLDYLALARPARSLSGGESQRIRLASQIGAQLVNVLYILDEPSIGLHQRDNVMLIRSLKRLRDIGNTVVVVEHDRDMMLAADYIIDIGPKAGRRGGEVVFQGTPAQMLRARTLTADYLGGLRDIPLPATRRKGSGKLLTVRGARGNNLRAATAAIPLGTLTVITGVSGSGKSTLINETLLPALAQRLYRAKKAPMPCDAIEGMELIDKVVSVDQSPIGRTPRSNAATFTGVFSDIRQLFAALPEARMRAYRPGRFSFNVKGGRCEACAGCGYKAVQMNFLPDVIVPCEVCQGKRYNRETLEVRYKGKSIADILDMTINQAVEFFQNLPAILAKIQTLQSVGLGYIKLGQPASTLSGGENQRVKLAAELAKRDTGQTLYILDEPTTGLHFEDIRILAGVLQQLVDKGNTVVVIEHNMDIICLADYIIDMGPEGGRRGGEVVATGTPEHIAAYNDTPTARYLKTELERKKAQ